MTNSNKDWLDEQIDCAIREHGAVEHFRELEATRQARPWFAWRWITGIPMALAACAVAIAVVIPSYRHQASAGYEYSMQELVTVMYRGDDVLRDKLNEAIRLLNDDKSAEALAALDDINARSKNELATLSDDAQDVVRKAEIKSIANDAQWYRAMAYMRSKKVIKAKSLLREISKSESIHRDEAKRILKEVY